jgi:hypothetical protein
MPDFVPVSLLRQPCGYYQQDNAGRHHALSAKKPPQTTVNATSSIAIRDSDQALASRRNSNFRFDQFIRRKIPNFTAKD